MASDPVSKFLTDIRRLNALPAKTRYSSQQLFDYPFDLQLLTASRLYRVSRDRYLDLGGRYSPRISSTMRSLSAQDLFANEIDYTPSMTELKWFAENSKDVYDPDNEISALERFNTISVFHEQNHRILWSLLPPAPKKQYDFLRYLNFAESLVVTLDLALGDELGAKLSPAFERMKVVYRTSGAPKDALSSKANYRRHLSAVCCATYFILEMMNPEDVLKALDYVLPKQKKTNRAAVSRALDISELFIRITNPQWQERSWKLAQTRLAKLHKGSSDPALSLPVDPLDFDHEFEVVESVLKTFGL
jgi:hypothetical protein